MNNVFQEKKEMENNSREWSQLEHTRTAMFINIYLHVFHLFDKLELLFSLEALPHMFAYLWCNCRVSLSARRHKLIPHRELVLHHPDIHLIKTFMEVNKHTNTAWESRSSLLWPVSCGLCSLLLDLYGWANSMYYPILSPVCVCVCVLWSDSLVDYIISVSWMLFPLPTFHILYIYRTGNLWHMTRPRQEMCPAFCCFCEIFALACKFSHWYLPAHGCSLTVWTHTHTVTLVPTVTAHQLWGHGPVWPPQSVSAHGSCPWACCYI